MFGDASKTVVIEEFLDGIECSVFVMTDGESYKVLPVAKEDYKRDRRRQYWVEYRREWEPFLQFLLPMRRLCRRWTSVLSVRRSKG
ncbi:MAG: hypothetical protein ACLRS8_06875 [Parabacteroides merdae]